MTEKQFIDIFSRLGSSNDRSVYSIKDNTFNISYHIDFYGSPRKYNFWFDRPCYLQKGGEVVTSMHDKSKKKESEKLRNIFYTSSADELKEKVAEIINFEQGEK